MNHVFNANVIMLMQFIFFKVHIGRVGNNARLCKQNHWEILDVALLKHFIAKFGEEKKMTNNQLFPCVL